MATTEITYDDVDTSVTEDVQKVQLALDGVTVEVDLGTQNREKLKEFLNPFISAGRPVAAPQAEKVERATARKSAVAPKARSTAPATKAVAKKITSDRAAMAEENNRIRAWAVDQGIELNPRGRIPNEVKEQFRQANPLTLVS